MVVPNKNEDRTLQVAVLQTSLESPDIATSLHKALAWIEKAAVEGARFVCLGETFLPGYPAWLDHCPEAALWNHPPVKKAFAQLRANSVVVPGQETTELSKTASRLGIGIAIGVNERVESGQGHGTLYNSLLLFDERGNLVNHHRKLIPTYSERMIWGSGDAVGLRCGTIQGIPVGGLICWEHWMPLARQHMHNCGEKIHVAAWPTVHEMHQVASRHYAFEGRCFVLAAGQIMRASALPANLGLSEGLTRESMIERGGSAIIAPDGRYLAGPVFEKETILMATVDLQEIEEESMTLDVSGHYSRPDIFHFDVIRSERS
jgi:nitrilase